MYFLNNEIPNSLLTAHSLNPESAGRVVALRGIVQGLRSLGGLVFLVLRNHAGFHQVVLEKAASQPILTGMAIEAVGRCCLEERAKKGVELRAESIRFLNQNPEGAPMALNKKKLSLNLETDLELRPISLRHETHYHRFKLQAALAQAFRRVLQTAEFQEIFTPKLVGGNAEGGANVFSLQYFGREAYLTQSPQLYKQMMVGVYGRVFETAHVYRAEQHNTSRHLNEYVSLDFELGFVETLEQLVAVQAEIIAEILQEIQETAGSSLAALEIQLPNASKIPALHLNEAKTLLREHGYTADASGSLSSAEEKELGKVVAERFGSEFVFVTHYHLSERPFYTLPSPDSPEESQSFDLIFRGVEITTGGLRIHDYQQLKARIEAANLEPEAFRHYLMAFKHGMPPHGGSGTGLERLTALLSGENNVRQGSLFPRDISRLTP